MYWPTALTWSTSLGDGGGNGQRGHLRCFENHIPDLVMEQTSVSFFMKISSIMLSWSNVYRKGNKAMRYNSSAYKSPSYRYAYPKLELLVARLSLTYMFSRHWPFNPDGNLMRPTIYFNRHSQHTQLLLWRYHFHSLMNQGHGQVLNQNQLAWNIMQTGILSRRLIFRI